jgi:pimeloyl-ACP methyl ester carboxylesterase
MLLFYGMVIVFFSSIETQLVFPAPTDSHESLARAAREYGAQELWTETPEGEKLYGWRVGQGERLAILFTGNGSGVGLEPDRYEGLQSLGFSVLQLNYPGYPGSSGKPSEAGIISCARAAWGEALRTHSADEIVLYGKSLGGFAVLSLAADLGAAGGPQPRAVVVESSFSSAVAVAGEMYSWLPVGWFMKNKMASLDRAAEVVAPVLLLHGSADDLIGPHHSSRLHEVLPRSTLIEIEGAGHNENLGRHPDGAAALRALLLD